MRVRNAASGTSYFLSKNRIRFVILLAVLTFLILQNSVHTLVDVADQPPRRRCRHWPCSCRSRSSSSAPSSS